MKIHNFEQGTQEWFEIRLGKFGSSDAQAVSANGKGLQTLCFQKAAEMMTGYIPNDYTNEHLERGKLLESSARTIYELKTGTNVEEVGYVELNDRVGASPDGLVDEDGMVEIKCPSDRVFVEFLFSGKVDTKYMWQMQHQMYVCERQWCDYVVYNENLDRIEITRIERDEKKIEKIKTGLESGIKLLEEIWQKINKEH